MKNTHTHPLFFVIIVTVIGLAYVGVIPNSYATTTTTSAQPHPNADYNEQVSWQQDHLWHLGKNLSVGDSYTYKICDPGVIQTSAANYHYFTQENGNHNSSVCYIIKMDFVNLLNLDENQINHDVWVIQAAISDNIGTNRDDVRYSVLHVDSQTFEVRSADTIHPDTIRYSDSLQKTLFSLFKYTATEPQLLQIGTSWGEVTEALRERGANPHMTVLDDTQEYSVTQNNIRMIDKQNIPVTRNIADAFKVGYEIDIFDPFIISDDKKKKKKMAVEEDNNNVTNYFLISSDLPFPLSAISYSPVHMVQPQKQFEFELVAFLANNNIDLGIRPVFEESKENDIREIPTETGKIELTFPSDVVDDDIVTANDDDIVVEVVSIYDDVVVHDDDVVIDDDDIDHVSVYNIIQSDDVDYAKIAGLVVLLVVMIAVFLVFKKFKESGFKTEIKKTLKKKQQQYTVKEIVSFDDKLHIDIKTITNGN